MLDFWKCPDMNSAWCYEFHHTRNLRTDQKGMMVEFSEHFFTATDGLRTYFRLYLARGAREKIPVLCMHGLTRNSRDFEEIAPRIAAKGHNVIAVDIRGRGKSGYDTQYDNYNLSKYVEDVQGLLRRMGWSRIIAIGASMGGLMVMMLSAARPGLLAGAVLNDIGPVINPEGLARIQDYVGGSDSFASWADAADAVRAINGIAFPDETGTDFWLAFAHRICREKPDGDIVFDYDPNISRPVQNEDEASPDLWLLFASLRSTPLLLVRGALTDLLTMDCVREMGRRHGRMKLAQVADVGHAPLLTEPDAWGSISDFLDTLDHHTPKGQ